MIESGQITPEFLRKASRLDPAQRYLEIYEAARYEGGAVLVKACSDSRLVFPKGVGEIRTIAGGGPNSPHNPVLLDPYFPVIAVVNHFDGRTVAPAQIPGGCGGRDGKAQLVGLDSQFDEGTLKFLKEHVWDADLVKQTVIGASFTSDRSKGKPTLAAAMDHMTLQTLPVGFVRDETTVSKVPVYQMMAPEYFPRDTYRNGIPTIKPVSIDHRLRTFLDASSEVQEDYGRRYDLDNQRSQTPETVVLTTELRSPRYRFNQAFDSPGSYFQISLALSNPDNSWDVDKNQRGLALDQLDYPQEHFPVKTIIVETRNMLTSNLIAQEIRERDFMQKWLGGKGNRILIAETIHGITEYADTFHVAR